MTVPALWRAVLDDRPGCIDKRSVSPRCPDCPPALLPEGRRSLLVRLAQGGSVEGGRLELCESFATSTSSSAFLRPSRKLSACRSLTSACNFSTCVLSRPNLFGQALNLPLMLGRVGLTLESRPPESIFKEPEEGVRPL